jgi:hypothetical protein
MAQSPSKGKNPSWHAVSVAPHDGACEQAQQLEGQRFLSAEAPTLPLKDCPMGARCRCVYKHHEDRRKGPRRMSEQNGLTAAQPRVNRRAGRGRRSTD